MTLLCLFACLMLWMAEWKQSDVLAFGLCPFLFRPDVVTMELVLFHISKETLCFLATLPMVRPWRDIRDLIALPSSRPVASKWMGIGTPELCGLINADGGSPLKVSLILIYADLFSDSVSPHLHCIPWNSTLPKHMKSSSWCVTVDLKGSVSSSDWCAEKYDLSMQ